MQAATAVANNGKMLKPYIIKEIKDAESGETISKGVSEVVGQPISSETAKKDIENFRNSRYFKSRYRL